jgi:hypothetical protein
MAEEEDDAEDSDDWADFVVAAIPTLMKVKERRPRLRPVAMLNWCRLSAGENHV